MKVNALTLVLSIAFLVLLGTTFFLPVASETIDAKTVKFEPKLIDLDNPDEIVGVTIRFAPKYSGQELNINASTVLLEGSLPIISGSNSTGTQPPEWKANFDGSAVANIVWTKIYHMGVINPLGYYVVQLTVTGKLYDGTAFAGAGPIKVKPGHHSPPPPPPP